ncbi:EAL domain-containing protein (putative c-di-GMP-specific phosphodiesterase class I) [Paraburkholderia sp. BL23I1N1]|uniref:EAL domain-containing protein n=1 Tax=Paraburkholderia sp. BL23I1N1 TaxID=1938802 RepID=UPI000E70AD79|nr:EAL domain-containing protein [Paraburkholderia sp. BL23I1N1]RKE37797.1 EAL domain-containing protein (putative c-di-GMP-specific phosphodiesterase class I) [Paraburkholderia sp. BL23I1N1]
MLTLDYQKPVSLATTFGTRNACIAQTDWDDSRGDAMALSDLENRVRDGLREGEFHLVFQGVYRAANRALTRLDAQVRWTHPDYGLLLPGIFMMPLEHPEVAREMALFVIDGVCRELRDCLASKMALLPVAITVPAQVAVLESFADDLARIARSYGVPANLLEIEVPDSADAARFLALRTLTAGLRSAGAGISLGKWGNGASSLALLGALDVDTVTIAPELIATVPRDPRACVVVSALLDMLRALDVQVVVNGVETQAQLQWLTRSWPEALVQGFLFSRPKAGLAHVLALGREQ